MKRFNIKLITTLVLISTLVFTITVFAQDQTVHVGDINIDPIVIPFFVPFNPTLVGSMTIFSWISFAGAVATVGLVVLWIYLIIRASVKALQSRGEAEGLQDVNKRFQSIFVGMLLTFIVPFTLSVIGVLLGIGTIFAWPKMFSQCNEGVGQYQFYFQAYLAEGEESADINCGYTTPTQPTGPQ